MAREEKEGEEGGGRGGMTVPGGPSVPEEARLQAAESKVDSSIWYILRPT